MNAIYAAPELGKTPANHVPLSPISMLKRTAQVHPEQLATIHGDSTRTWAEVERRCRRLASALERRGVARGDTVGYTSSTTGDPKGVVYSHRGAYLNAVNNTVCWAMPHFPVYLWTLPMFHCNGWCFPWSVTLLAGFKRPKRIVIGELPKTSTGKIRKNELRDLVRSGA